jgi:CubicO group peptidase (beta-lactamase class C family)
MNSRAMKASLFAAACLACGSDPETGAEAAERHWPTGAWATEAPEAQGMDSALLERARDYAFDEGRNTQGVVVVRHGVIVAEWYAPGASADSWVTSWSVAKSITSALVGIAIDEGLIESVDVSMSRFIPEWAGTEKEAITLRHVLQMAPGLEWNEEYDPTAAGTSDVIQLVVQSGSELEYAAERPLVAEPGTVFNYSSGTSMLLSAVVEEATGSSALEYARRKLFGPLGFDRIDWWESTRGHTLTYCCVDTTSRDLARFGLLYARGGEWSEGPVVPAAWVNDSVAPSPARPGYGYQWWLLGMQAQGGAPNRVPASSPTVPAGTFAALGVDGQVVYVAPHLDLVVVRSGTYVKDDGPAIADPHLLSHMPPSGLVEGKGTVGPEDWDLSAFLNLVIEAVRD